VIKCRHYKAFVADMTTDDDEMKCLPANILDNIYLLSIHSIAYDTEIITCK